jgi:IclR family mhp operon transcriptional activator
MVIVESICRGLDVLRIVNERADQCLSQISQAVGLPRGTSYRLLVTLEAAGLVQRTDNQYRVTQRVRSLSHGFDNDWIEDVAHPVVRELGQELLWPIALTEHNDGCVVIRANTDPESPFTLEPVRVGTRMSMLDTASGRILLAHSSPLKQQSLLDYVKTRNSGRAPAAAGYFAEAATTIRKRGYDLMPTANGRQTALAVAVLDDAGQAHAALSVRYFNAAMTAEEAVRRFIDPLRASASRIGGALRARQGLAH